MNLNHINVDQVTVIDVREPWEFEFGHVDGSINIPLRQIPANIELLEKMAMPLVLICATGNRSGHATTYLRSLEFREVYNGGGWREWQTRMKKAA